MSNYEVWSAKCKGTHCFDCWLRGGIRASFSRSFGLWNLRRFMGPGVLFELIQAGMEEKFD